MVFLSLSAEPEKTSSMKPSLLAVETGAEHEHQVLDIVCRLRRFDRIDFNNAILFELPDVIAYG